MPPPRIATQIAIFFFFDIVFAMYNKQNTLNLFHYDLVGSCVFPICRANSITSSPKSLPQKTQWKSYWVDIQIIQKQSLKKIVMIYP